MKKRLGYTYKKNRLLNYMEKRKCCQFRFVLELRTVIMIVVYIVYLFAYLKDYGNSSAESGH